MTTITDTWTVTVPEGVERQEDTSITPGNYRVHRLQAGTYPVIWTTIQGHPVHRPEDAYYGEAHIPSVLLRERHHERLGAATRNRVEDLHEQEAVFVHRFYEFQLREPGPVKYRPDLTLDRRSA